jgi:hypothetical protein
MSVAPANTSSIIVAVTGVVQDPSTYSVSGTTLTFSAAPPTGTSNISVRYLGIPASGVTTTAYRTVTDTTATAGQTTFSIPSYTVGYVDVYRNGSRLAGSDYTATSGTSVVLVNAASAGDTITTESFYVSSVLNALPNTGGTVSGQVTINAPTGQNPFIAQVNSTEVFEIDSAGNVGIAAGTPRYKISIGSLTPTATATPDAMDFGGTISSTPGANPKLRLYWDGVNALGFGISASQLEYVVPSGSSHVFFGSGTERMRILGGAPILCLAGGNTSATGTGIAFPAAFSGSSDVNTLDDYEEGTWTPTDASGAGLAFVTSSGYYTKVGRVVTASAEVQWPATANTSNAALTLPIAQAGLTRNYTNGAAMTNNNYTLNAFVQTNIASFYRQPLAAFTQLTNANISSGYIYLTISYFAAT